MKYRALKIHFSRVIKKRFSVCDKLTADLSYAKFVSG